MKESNSNVYIETFLLTNSLPLPHYAPPAQTFGDMTRIVDMFTKRNIAVVTMYLVSDSPLITLPSIAGICCETKAEYFGIRLKRTTCQIMDHT